MNTAARTGAATLGEIVSTFGRLGNFTFGGGAATTAALQREIVARKHWLDETGFALCYALSRITPGTNLFAFCTASGWLLRRWRGALAALLAASIPSCLLVWAATAGFDSVNRYAPFRAAAAGAMAASAGILLASFWSLVGPHLTRRAWPRTSAITVASIALSLGAGLSPIAVLAIAAAVGLLWKEPAAE